MVNTNNRKHDDIEDLFPWYKAIENMGRQKSYKSILLLSILKEIELGNIESNKITLNNEIVERFNNFYEAIGNQYAINRAYLAYYYLENDVWSIHWANNAIFKRPESIKSANKNIKYVEFNPDLFRCLKVPKYRELIKERLFLKAEEDIKTKDPRRNKTFQPPSNAPEYLENHFDKINKTIFTPEFTPQITSKPLILDFVQENLMRDFLVERWTEIPEFQKQNLKIFQGDKIGVEYDTGSAGRIDILAENNKTHDLTVIELKKGIGNERHLGQVLRYMGWVRSKLAINNKVFGLLIASNFRERIQYAITEIPTVSLMEYELVFKIRPLR